MGQKLTKDNCKPGDEVVCVNADNNNALTLGQKYTLSSTPYFDSKNELIVNITLRHDGGFLTRRFELTKQESIANKTTNTMKNIVTNAKSEVTEFIETNKNLLYWVAILVVVDQFFLEGKFREKLKEIFESLITKVKAKLDDIHI